jgi:hypothetical protein
MMASFFALKGFQTQLKYMMEKERLLFSIGAYPPSPPVSRVAAPSVLQHSSCACVATARMPLVLL